MYGPSVPVLVVMLLKSVLADCGELAEDIHATYVDGEGMPDGIEVVAGVAAVPDETVGSVEVV